MEPQAPQTLYPAIIVEVSEPTSPNEAPYHFRPSSGRSTLTELIRNSPPQEEAISDADADDATTNASVCSGTTGGRPIIHATERTALLLPRAVSPSARVQGNHFAKDLESQDARQHPQLTEAYRAFRRTTEKAHILVRMAVNPKSWDRRSIWTYGVEIPAAFLSPITLGLLLNILDALSYGNTAPVHLSCATRLIWYRNDPISAWPGRFRRSWTRRSINVLYQLHCIAIGVLTWRQCIQGRHRVRDGKLSQSPS